MDSRSHILQDWLLCRPYRWEESVTVADQSSITTEIDDDFSISVVNTPTAKSPPRNDPPRASKDIEPRGSNHTRHPLQCVLADTN